MAERRSPLYDYHLRHSGLLVKGGGDFLFPDAYTSATEEHLNVRANVGINDLSSMGEVDVKGPGAERLINRLLVNEIGDLEPGQVRYSTMCDDDGGIVDDLTVYKFSDEHFMIVTSSGPRTSAIRWIADHAAGQSAYVTDVTASVGLATVQGPRSRDFLREVVRDVEIDALRFFRFAPARIGETEFLLSRSGYTGELGFELYLPAEEMGAVWEHLLKVGREFGLLPYGANAMQSLRIEKALPLYGNDINEAYTPFHVGLDRFIRFDKREFNGRDALLSVQDAGIRERWVGLVIHGPTPADVNDPISSVGDVASFRALRFTGPEAGEQADEKLPGEVIGHVTSSNRGHSVGKTLALGYVGVTHAWPGANLIVSIAGRPVAATVSATPFFDAEGSRMRAKVIDAPERTARTTAMSASIREARSSSRKRPKR